MKKCLKLVMISVFVLMPLRLDATEGDFLSPDPNIGLEVTADKTTAAVNEKIKVNYNLYTRYDTRYEGFETIPSLRGFSVEETAITGNGPRATVRLNGKRYIKMCVKEVFISPIYGGDLVIDPGVMRVSIAEGPKTKASPGLRSHQRKTVLLESKPMTIHVENPAGKSKTDLLTEYYNSQGAKTPSLGIKIDKPAVIFVLDISGTMMAEDMQHQNRLASAKAAISKFLQANTAMMVGLECFAQDVKMISPLTQNKSEVIKALEGVQPGLFKDGTSIGDAVFEATKELSGYTGKKKAIILITDGISNGGRLYPFTAVDFAINDHVVVHTIALGTQGLVPFPVDDPKLGKRIVMTEVGTDEPTLAGMAKETGGRSGTAKSGAELEGLLNEIQKTLAGS